MSLTNILKLVPLLKLLTTSTAGGVATRDLIMIAGTVLAVVGSFGLLTPEQVDYLRNLTNDPALWTAGGTLVTAVMSAYRIITKSSSDKAAEVAKEVDAKIPKANDVVIETPGRNTPNIVVPGQPRDR